MTSESSSSLSSSLVSLFARFRFCPAFARGFLPFPALLGVPFFCAVEVPGVPGFETDVLPLPTLALLPWLRLPPLLAGVVGISMFIEVFIPIITLRLISSYPEGRVPVGVTPKEVSPDALAPELMRFKIISVAAENWGTYLGGELLTAAPLDMPVGVGSVDLSTSEGSIVNEVEEF